MSRKRIFTTEEAETEAMLLWVQGYNISRIAERFRCDRSSVYNLFFNHGIDPRIRKQKLSAQEALRRKRERSRLAARAKHGWKGRSNEYNVAYYRRVHPIFPRGKSYKQYLKEYKERHPPIDLKAVKERMEREIEERKMKWTM